MCLQPIQPQDRGRALRELQELFDLAYQARAEVHTPQAKTEEVAEACRRKFSRFVKEAWPNIDPAPLSWGPHLDAICDHLEAITHWMAPDAAEKYGWPKLEWRNLLINIGPGMAKSMIVSVLYPVWLWVIDPRLKTLGASYRVELTMRDAVKSRTLIASQWFEQLFGRLSFAEDQNTKGLYRNDKMGERFSTSVGGGLGFRSDVQIIDDPLSVDDSYSELKRQTAITWITETLSSRANDQKRFIRIMIMQRLHEEDPSGYVLEHDRESWCHLMLPSEFEPERKCVTQIFTDWRTYEGQPLFPDKYPKEVLDKIKMRGSGMGPTAYAGQHQQRPAPAEGAIVKRADIMRWKVLPSRFDEIIQSWDCATKDKPTGSYVVGQVWGRRDAEFYLIHQVRDHMDFPATKQAMRDLSKAYPRAIRKLVEAKANGPAAIADLKGEIPGMVPVETGEADKEARFRVVSAVFEAHNVFIPEVADWVDAWVHEITTFPGSRHNDQVDACSQALAHFLHNAPIKGPSYVKGQYGHRRM